MKRAGNLMERIADLDNLALAFWRAARGKAGQEEVEAFRADLATGLPALRRALLCGVGVPPSGGSARRASAAGTAPRAEASGRLPAEAGTMTAPWPNCDMTAAARPITFGPYRQFRVFDPKERVISVAPFRDRVLHHALMNVCEPVFDRYAIHDTYACRKDKGCHRGVLRAQDFSRRFPWFVKLDIRRYYDSVDHDVLFRLLCRRFKDPALLVLLRRLIDSYETTPDKGLPIGNLTSQHFANCYLGEFDHWVKEQKRVEGYVRYMDDFVLWGRNAGELRAQVREIRQFLHDDLRLDLKDEVLVNRCGCGLPFLGYRVFPGRVLLSRRSRARFRRKFLAYDACWRTGEWSEAYVARRMAALIAWTRFAEARGFRQKVLRLAEEKEARLRALS